MGQHGKNITAAYDDAKTIQYDTTRYDDEDLTCTWKL